MPMPEAKRGEFVLAKARQRFFFEKKKQKTFSNF